MASMRHKLMRWLFKGPVLWGGSVELSAAPTMGSGRPWRAGLVLALAGACAGLSGCGVVKTVYASNPYFDSQESGQREDGQDDEMSVLAQRFGLMALFAKAVYRNDMKDPGNGEGCSYLSDHQPSPTALPTYGMPSDSTGGWRRVSEVVTPGVHPCVDKGGLYFETYIHQATAPNARVDTVVIAFRGTENSANQIVADWSTNFSAALGVEPSEYRVARLAMDDLVKNLMSRYTVDGQKPDLYAVGHSLGGGLAQQLGYMRPEVKAVYTFNTTPVTNWSSLRLVREVGNNYPTIYRLEHGGEFLSLPRGVASAATTSRYGRYDIQVQIEKKSLFGGHAVAIFACRFAELIAQGDAKYADPLYPKSYANQILVAAHHTDWPDHGLCVSRKQSIDPAKYSAPPQATTF